MKKMSKKRKEIISKIELVKKYEPIEAIQFLKNNTYVKFDESLDISINLSIDVSKSDQNIRGVVNLPNGTGKTIKVAVIAKEENASLAKEKGADLVGDNELIEKIEKGYTDFDILITSPDMMKLVSKLGKSLGPKGLMPNPKLGTVTNDIGKAVLNAKSGQVQYKNDKSGIVHAGIGKIKFKEEELLENLKTFYEAIIKSKPDTVKGSFVKKVSIASTMGVGIEINTSGLH
ncbi:MAG: 50S ribosomal protein L1 [Alphaproteobacteria bacterium MarineAlpha5_Bin9]|nr:MAG: 50S ribosomal protein L1 [Alphaproteobacteria bacterium MarineAlpha5_Bin9]|tara:strand:+ start:15915 stop:16607 length:693 start_codon:yes stop_codon:yes gene_type:complete